MYIDNFMYDMSLNDKGELVLLIEIPKEHRDDGFENVEIRIPERDIDRMKHIFQMNRSECENCGNPWKMG